MKIGIYGGSFNPPHLGHMAAAESAARYLQLDKLILIPAGIPPHKALSTDEPGKAHRLAMTRLMGEQAALDTRVEVEVSSMEIEREGKSYTADSYKNAMSLIQDQFEQDQPYICLYWRSAVLLSRETFTDVRDVRELEMLRGIENYGN